MKILKVIFQMNNVFAVFLLLIIICPKNVFANDKLPSRASKISMGYNVQRFQDDFGIGINLTSPYFINDKVAIRLSANMSFFEGIPENENEIKWMPYGLYKLGLIGVGGKTSQSRFYGEGGFVYIVPNSKFSDEGKFGGYGVFGFEFFMSEELVHSYYIELGGVGTAARAEKINGKPIYSNGFITSVGFRYNF